MTDVANDTQNAIPADPRLPDAERIVGSAPAVLGGELCIVGTRVPVYLIGNLAARVGVEEALATYPFLGRRTVELALVYVTAYPGAYAPDESWLLKLRQKAPARRVHGRAGEA